MEPEQSKLEFMGRDFLTWLWFKSEERNGAILIPGQGDIEIQFLRRIVLESGQGEYSETVTCSGLHADLSEGKAALRAGKKVREARIKMGVGSDEWEFTFKADGFLFQSVKLPSSFEDEEGEMEKEGRVLDRIGCIEVIMKTMERLFAYFLYLRRSEEWVSREAHRMDTWIAR
ncbi:MAG: hypothetical protein PHU03_02445 [Syntrophales bacterium]|nr:hypothetical protein [Syntrophales bacterium]